MDQKLALLFKNWKQEYLEAKDELTELDSVGGDGDLGIVMMAGFNKLYQFILELDQNDIGKIFYFAGKQFNNFASSSMGTLISSGFITIGKKLKGKNVISKEDLVVVLEGMAEGVQNLGKANEGEKTFLDAIFPAARAARKGICLDTKTMMNKALDAAEEGVKDATNMIAKHGRLAFRGDDSKGIIDPGTMCAYHFVKAILKSVEEENYE